MKYTLSITNKELLGVYAIDKLLKSPKTPLSHDETLAAKVIVNNLIKTVEAGDLVKFVPSAPLRHQETGAEALGQSERLRKVMSILDDEYGIGSSRKMMRWYLTLFAHGIPQMERLPTWDAVEFILEGNEEAFAYFVYGLNAYKSYKAQLPTEPQPTAP